MPTAPPRPPDAPHEPLGDRLTMTTPNLPTAGTIFPAPGVFGHGGDRITAADKLRLDALHLTKIDLACWVLVVNPGGYIGDSTRREIAHAGQTGKPVHYLEQVAA